MTYHKISTVTLFQTELLHSHKKIAQVGCDSRTVQPNREFGSISAKFKVAFVLIIA